MAFGEFGFGPFVPFAFAEGLCYYCAQQLSLLQFGLRQRLSLFFWMSQKAVIVLT